MQKKLFRGFRVRIIAAILMVISCLLTAFIFHTTIKIKNNSEEIYTSNDNYVKCNLAIIDLKKISGKLTYFAICFLENKDYDYLDRYLNQLRNFKLENHSAEIITKFHKNDVVDVNAKLALKEANILVGMETYAMRLMCEGLNYRESNIPKELKNIKLLKEHLNLPDNEKIITAQNMMFSQGHLRSRDLISEYTEEASNALIEMYHNEVAYGGNMIKYHFNIQVFLIVVLFVICIFFYVVLVILIFIPLSRYLIAIQNNDKMKMRGAYEVRYIATAYNALCDKNALDASILKHKAEHDPLTGLINREAFGNIMTVLSGTKEPVAYLIVDIDLFKNINDEFGHVTGDNILVKIAHLLTEQFRATDYVARIGGDEFAVIMTKFGTAPVMEIIRKKIDGLNNMLKSDSDGLPPVSLSVGVAFSDMGFKTSLIEQADKALYRVKRGGRCNCFFYGAE